MGETPVDGEMEITEWVDLDGRLEFHGRTRYPMSRVAAQARYR